MTPRLDGFDVSHYQGAFPWEYSRSLGCTLGSAKATQGLTFVDPQLARNRAEMSRTGHRYRGLYHWVSPGVPVTSQLENFVRAVGDLAPGECVQLDCEERPISAAEVLAAWQAWTARYPGRVIVYSGAFLNGWQALPELVNAPWWLAWYRSTSWDELNAYVTALRKFSFPWQPTVWQWGGGANGVIVPGVTSTGGHVDSNQIIRADVLEALCGYTSSPPPVAASPQGDETVEFYAHNTDTGELAYVVIDGAGTEVYGKFANMGAVFPNVPTMDVNAAEWADLLAHRAARLPAATSGSTTVTVPEIPIHLTVSAG